MSNSGYGANTGYGATSSSMGTTPSNVNQPSGPSLGDKIKQGFQEIVHPNRPRAGTGAGLANQQYPNQQYPNQPMNSDLNQQQQGGWGQSNYTATQNQDRIGGGGFMNKGGIGDTTATGRDNAFEKHHHHREVHEVDDREQGAYEGERGGRGIGLGMGSGIGGQGPAVKEREMLQGQGQPGVGTGAQYPGSGQRY